MENGKIISRTPGLTVAEISGAPYEMGRAHGGLFAGEIALMRERLLSYLSTVTYGIGGRAFLWYLGRLAGRMGRFVPAELKEEMRGIADGSRQDYRFIFLMNALDDMLVNLACSAVAAGPGLTKDKKLIVGRNLDYPLFYDLLPMLNTVFKVRPDTGHSFVCVGWPGFASVVTGMNDAGLVIADLTSISRDRTMRGIPALLLNRTALQGAGTLEEAVDTYTRASRTVGKNIMAASPSRAVVLELSARSISTREAEGGLLACANHYTDPGMAAVQGSVTPPPKSDFPAHYYTYSFSKERMDALERLSCGRDLEVEDVEKALSTPPVANDSNVQSVVFVPEARRIFVAVRETTPVSQGAFVEVTGLF